MYRRRGGKDTGRDIADPALPKKNTDLRHATNESMSLVKEVDEKGSTMAWRYAGGAQQKGGVLMESSQDTCLCRCMCIGRASHFECKCYVYTFGYVA